MDDLKEWLQSRNFKPAFFFDNSSHTPDYLDADNPHYSAKLAAVVHAWEAVRQEYASTSKNSPKQALEKWLRVNAKEYGLLHEDGKHNESAIKEIAKIANWNIKGGAPKTPSQQEKEETQSPIKALNDIEIGDIPF